MMIVRKSEERGRARYDWLDSRHSFSFADYYDPRHMGFRALRVINQDIVQPDSGFPTHPHRDMEILSLVLEGTLRHRDSMGNEGDIPAGTLQRMSAGTGILHSEWNPSPNEPVHFLQIWLLPEREGLQPGYEQRAAEPESSAVPWSLLASRDARDGSVRIHQDTELWRGRLPGGAEERFRLAPGRHAWLQVISGVVAVNGTGLRDGDGAAVSDETALVFTARQAADFLLFDLS